MSDIRVASRYAKSLIQLSVELDSLEKTYGDMMLIQHTCNESKELSLLLQSPLVKPDKKLSILKEVFGKNVSEMTHTFIELITNKKRELYLEQIATQFVAQYKKSKNIEVAKVTTAIPLNDDLRKEIPKLIEKTMDRKATIELIEEVDEDLIGGMVLRVGDLQLDESLRKKLRTLEMEFSRNPYIKKL